MDIFGWIHLNQTETLLLHFSASPPPTSPHTVVFSSFMCYLQTFFYILFYFSLESRHFSQSGARLNEWPGSSCMSWISNPDLPWGLLYFLVISETHNLMHFYFFHESKHISKVLFSLGDNAGVLVSVTLSTQTQRRLRLHSVWNFSTTAFLQVPLFKKKIMPSLHLENEASGRWYMMLSLSKHIIR